MKISTVSVAILSGKGGVGKSNIALNLCYALNKANHSVLLMDCDMGLANMDVLLGIAPQYHIQDILLEDRDPEDIIVNISPGPSGGRGFDLLPANSGMSDFADLDNGARDILRERINPLAAEYDFLFLDIGAGISPTALEFGAMAGMRLVIVTPEPTSLTDSYALMKVMAARYQIEDFFIVVNQAESPAEGKQTYNRLTAVCQRFLGFAPKYLGHIRLDRAMSDAVCRQKPLLQINPQAPAALDCTSIAAALRRLRMDCLAAPEALRKSQSFG